jgi:hypothetical protein
MFYFGRDRNITAFYLVSAIIFSKQNSIDSIITIMNDLIQFFVFTLKIRG